MKAKKWVYFGLPVVGTVLCLWYIKEATCDVVYSDYIRIVNQYLPQIWDPTEFFRADVLTRVPIYFLIRIINMTFFHYSTTFEMALGILGLGLSALVLGNYCQWKQVSLPWYVFLMFLLFGLDKWEMMINGTGWPHFLAFACFYYHYLLFDRVLYGEEKRFDRALLLGLPPVVTVLIAGPYCAVYTVVMVLAYGFALVKDQRARQRGEKSPMDRRLCLAGLVSVLVPLFLYMWSNSYAFEDHDGAIKLTLWEMVARDPVFFPRFLMKALSSMIIGGETLMKWVEEGLIGDGTLYALGALLIGGYALAFWLNVRCRLYEKTLVPLMLLFAGMGNHAIIMIARYIFAREDYGMSSRYALQYQAGLLGMVLTFALTWHLLKEKGRAERILALAMSLFLLAGHGYTDYEEIKKAPYRELYGENIEQATLQYETMDDDELKDVFDFRESRPDSGAAVRHALNILKENRLNVFSRH